MAPQGTLHLNCDSCSGFNVDHLRNTRLFTTQYVQRYGLTLRPTVSLCGTVHRQNHSQQMKKDQQLLSHRHTGRRVFMASQVGGDDRDDAVVFKYVYIPADHTESIEERTFKCPQSDDVMGFINMCKAHFTNAAVPRNAAEQQQWQKAFKESLGDKAAGVSDDMINMLAQQQMVEPIALMTNSPDTGFVGVNMYCDDQASLKQLPPNMRATQIAAEAGQALQVRGDVFIGRFFDNEDDFKRMDFTQSELNSSAQWIKESRQQLQRRTERSGQTQALLQRLQKPQQAAAAAGHANGAGAHQPAASPSEAEKCKGNEAYRKRDYSTALEHYTAAIKLDTSNTAARNNRAATYLALNMYPEAAADAAAVLQAEPSNVKALLRQAAALQELGRLQEAAEVCDRALQLEPSNTDAQQRLAKLKPQMSSNEQQQQQTPSATQQQHGAEPAPNYPPPPAQ